MRLEFDVNMTTSALYDYNMHHTYTSSAGIIGTAFGALLLVLYMSNMQPAFLVAGVVVILYSPIALYMSAAKQVKLNPMYKKPLHYVMDDAGVTVSQDDNEVTVEWSQIYKATSTNQSLILYTGKTNAWVFPKKELGERRYDVIEAISTHVEPAKVKIKQ